MRKYHLRKLIKIYRKFTKYHRENFTNDVRKWFGTEKVKVEDNFLKKIYNLFYRPTFLEFFTAVRNLVYWKDPLDSMKRNSKDSWDAWYYTSFLISEDLVTIKNGKIIDSAFEGMFLPPYRRDEIIREIGLKASDLSQPTFKFIEKITGIKIGFKPRLDQLPISMDSAVNLIETIFRYYPFFNSFLFIGDDDFISVLTTFVDSRFKPSVVDADKELISLINQCNPEIKTEKKDIRKGLRFSFKILGFCTNPPYTELGVKMFVKAGISNFSSLGGRVFLEVGEESIKSARMLDLQRWFSEHRLKVLEIKTGAIYYPFTIMHEEDKIIYRRLSKLIPENSIRKSSMLSASLYVFDYIPWKVKPLRVKGADIYTYI